MNHYKPTKKANQKNYPKILGIILLVIGLLFILKVVVMALLSPSLVNKLPTGDLKKDNGYTNILLLGIDEREGEEEIGLTDTMMLVSISEKGEKAVIFAIPRDIWISNEGKNLRINKLYRHHGIAGLSSEITHITGLPIHYYVVIDFEGFIEAINLIGGVDIEVENAFTDNSYPITGMEDAKDIEDRYETISFEKGYVKMDGETALKYARSRHAVGVEGSDFARSRRQQKVLIAVQQKILSASTIFNLSKLKNLFEIYSSSIDTNIGLSEFDKFYVLSQQLNKDAIQSTNINFLDSAGNPLFSNPEDLTEYGGAWVIIPRTGNYQEVQGYIQNLLNTSEN